MRKRKKLAITGFLLSLIAILSIVLFMNQTKESLHAKDKTSKTTQVAATQGIARSLDFYLRKAVTSGTAPGIDGVTFYLEVKKDEDNWEKVTGTNGKPQEFVTKEGGRIQLLELTIQELEKKYGQGPYRFYEVTQPEGDYLPSIGETSSEFSLPTSETKWQKTVTMYNRYIGTYTLTAKNGITNQPMAGVKMVLQYYYGSQYFDIGTNGNEEIEGLPKEFISNSAGNVTLSSEQISKLIGYANASRFRLCVVDVPTGYLVPVMGNQYFTISASSSASVSPANETISVYPNRELVFRKTAQVTGEPLANAEFELEVKAGSDTYETVTDPAIPLPNLKTDQNGQIKLNEEVLTALRQVYGTASTVTYRFKEVKAPAGYRPPTESSVSGTFTISDTTVKPEKVTLTNEKLPEEMVLEKRDAITNATLKDASFTVQKQNGDNWTNTSISRKTDDQGKIVLTKTDLSNLGNGTYRFKETAAPAGYEAPTDNTVSETFDIVDGHYSSKDFVVVRNEPKEKGNLYLKFIQASSSYLNAFDDHSGKGYVTAAEASQGWIRSNDMFKMFYTIAPEDVNDKDYKNVKIRVTAEVLNGKGYSVFEDKTKEPLQNVSFKINTPVNQLKEGHTYDPETKTVEAYQEFVLEEAQGSFTDISIEAQVGSSFYGTELPLKYTMQVISAVDPESGEEIQFSEGPKSNLYLYDLSLPIPNNTLKVTSKLNMIPAVRGDTGTTGSGIKKATFEQITGSADSPNSKFSDIGYGWYTNPLEGRATRSNLGLAVPKGNNQFSIKLDQSIVATLSNGDVVPLTLGSGTNADLPKIELFSFGKVGEKFGDPVGIYKGKYADYNQSILPRTYNWFARPGETVHYTMTQNQQNGELTASVQPPTYFPGSNGYYSESYNVLFGIGSYLVYPAEAASIVATRNVKAASSVIQQDYTIGVKGASYEDNDEEMIEINSESPIQSTWTEKFDENKPEKPKDELFLIMEKKDKNDGFLLTGGKFILEYYTKAPGSNTSDWFPVEIPGFTSFTTDANGQIVFDEAKLKQLFEESGGGRYRFKEVEAPDGYRDPKNYENQSELISGEFTLNETTISTRRVSINNRPKNPILIVNKTGKNQAGSTISLEGAVFDLYFGKPTKENPSKDEDYEWVRVDLKKVFNLTESELLEKFTSNQDGSISLNARDIETLAKHKDYGPGRYRFKEVVSPPGYILPEGDKAFTTSFYLTEDDVSPNEIKMENERVAEWKDATTYSIGSSYGYSVEKDGIPMFSKLGVEYTKPDSLATLVSRATPYSTTATNTGKVLRGEEIVVGSYQNATYYSYATDNTAYKENWKAKEAEMIQLWNPAEGELVEAGYNFFEDMSQIGKTEPIQYGVKKEEKYTVGDLDAATKDDYDWYPSMNVIPAGKKVSAIYGKITNFKLDYRGIHDKTVETRWNLYTRRIANGVAGNTDTGLSNSTLKSMSYYATYTRAKITYENYNPQGEEDKEVVKDWNTATYTPSRYSASGGNLNTTSSTPTNSFADTLLILPYYRPTITKRALNPETKELQPGNKYALNSMMEFSLKVEFPQPREGTNTLPFDFTVTDDVNYSNQPEDHFIYRKNSSSLNTNPIDNPDTTSITNHESNRFLEWKNIKASYAETNIYDLHFQAFPKRVGKFVNRTALPFSFYGIIGQNIDVEITEAMNSGGIYKNTTTPVIDKASNSNELPIDYTVTVKNYVPDKQLKGVKIFDLLPFNGDNRGSIFHGGYSLEKMSAESIDGSSLSDEETTYYYTTQSLPETLTANNAFDYPGANWKEFKDITPEERKQVKAIFVTMPDLPSGMAYDLSLELLPFGNEEGDRYLNRASFGFTVMDAYGNDVSAEVRSGGVETVVINRMIEGNVWQDLEYSGTMEPNEPKIEGVNVNLYRMDAGELIKIDETTTDKNGGYKFDGVPSGYFKVGFKLPEKYAGYVVTKTNVSGADPLLTNKVSQQDITDDDYHLTQDSIQLPFYEYEKDEEGNDTEKLKSVIEVKGINMGILPRPDLTVVKEVQKQDDKGNYHDINNQKVKIGDIIRYVITVSNPVPESYLEDIRIQDTLPAGLEYVDGTLTLVQKDSEEDEPLSKSKYTFTENENGLWELKTEPLGNLDPNSEMIQIYFDVRVTEKAKGKLTNVATATGSLPPELNYNESDETDNQLTPEPLLEKTSTWEGKDDGKPLKKGQEFTYTLTVKNAEGASSWNGVVLSDTLNNLMGDPENIEDYLVYVPNSTTVDGVNVKDTDSWKQKNQLTLNLGDFAGSADGMTKVVQFKVKLDKIPPKEDDGKIWIRNEATAVGRGINENDEEQEYSVSDREDFVLDKYQTNIKLHVRQVIVDPQDSLVVPKDGYLVLQQLDAANKKLVNGVTTIQMKSEKEGAQITSESFTTILVALLGDVQTLDLNLPIIPEYYAYLGSVVSTDGTKIASDHVSAKMEKDVRPKLSVSEAEEYWVTFFIQPKLNEEDQNLPRPYSWDTVSNQFGKLNLEE